MEEPNQDSQAIARLKQGDLAGLDVLLERYQLRAVRTAYLIVLDRPLAEDVVQNAFVRLAHKINQFDDSRPFAPWFMRSVINDALKAIRRAARQAPLEAEEAAGSTRLIDQLIDPGPQPEEWAVNAETCREVWQALASLPAAQRSVIVQRYYLGYSEAEMSLELQRPLGTIKWLLHSARKKLRRLLATLAQPAATNPEPGPRPAEAVDEE